MRRGRGCMMDLITRVCAYSALNPPLPVSRPQYFGGLIHPVTGIFIKLLEGSWGPPSPHRTQIYGASEKY